MFWVILLLSTLACRAATRLIIPDTPTPVPPTATLIIPTSSPTLPPPTPTPVFQVACPSLLSDIMQAANGDDKEPRIIRRSFRDVQEDMRYLVRYTINDDHLSNRKEIHVPADFKTELDTRAAHESIWDYFAALIPVDQRTFVTEFSAMSDGKSHILGAVSRTRNDVNDWGLRVDVIDASDHYRLTYTLIHEFGHLLTLKASQVTADRSVIFNPDEEELYNHAVSACPRYFAGDGCSTSASYINEFFQRYWTGIYEEWQQLDKEDESSYYAFLHSFYKSYADQFLTEYSATSPEEDIAEAWAFFVLAPKPDEPQTIAEQKILFFSEYPELVQLRQEILTRLCDKFLK